MSDQRKPRGLACSASERSPASPRQFAGPAAANSRSTPRPASTPSPSRARARARRPITTPTTRGTRSMLRTKSGLPKHCGWNLDREDGKRRVRFRKSGFSVYLTGIPWSPDFMAQYAAALQGVKAQATNIGANRTAAETVIAQPISTHFPPRHSRPSSQRHSGRATLACWPSISARPRAPMKPTSKFRYIPNCAMG